MAWVAPSMPLVRAAMDWLVASISALTPWMDDTTSAMAVPALRTRSKPACTRSPLVWMRCLISQAVLVLRVARLCTSLTTTVVVRALVTPCLP